MKPYKDEAKKDRIIGPNWHRSITTLLPNDVLALVAELGQRLQLLGELRYADRRDLRGFPALYKLPVRRNMLAMYMQRVEASMASLQQRIAEVGERARADLGESDLDLITRQFWEMTPEEFEAQSARAHEVQP